MDNTSPKLVRTFTITVTGGAGESGIQYCNDIANFSIAAPAGANFKYAFRDRDDFPIYAAESRKPGPQVGKIDVKSLGFVLRIFDAPDGDYPCRVYLNN